MNDKPKWKVARLDEIDPRGRYMPVREHLGIHSFGINAYRPGEDGTLINDHDESGSGQEELYVVLDWHATFEVDGETVDAPAGTYVSVPPGTRRNARTPRRRSPAGLRAATRMPHPWRRRGSGGRSSDCPE